MGSACELEYHFLLACDLGFVTQTEYQKFSKQLIETKKMLSGLIQKLKADR